MIQACNGIALPYMGLVNVAPGFCCESCVTPDHETVFGGYPGVDEEVNLILIIFETI
jgi:hypothetical protein